MFSGSENTLGTKWPQEPPKGPPRLPKAPKITRKHRFSSICVWCSDVICHIILARDSLAAFQASQDKTKIAIVAPSFHSIRLHISQGEYPNPPSTCERKRNSASYVQARWRGWPAGQLDIYMGPPVSHSPYFSTHPVETATTHRYAWYFASFWKE